MNASVEMPRYQSHKKVWALEIKDCQMNEQGEYPDGKIPPHPGWTMSFSDPEYAPRQIGPAVVSRYFPQPGDFFVVYDDGYESISPRQPFLDGYVRL